MLKFFKEKKEINSDNKELIELQEFSKIELKEGDDIPRELTFELELKKQLKGEVIDFSNCNLSEEELIEIAKSLKENTTVKKVKLSGNIFSEEVYLTFGKMLAVNKTLRELDVRAGNNMASYNGTTYLINGLIEGIDNQIEALYFNTNYNIEEMKYLDRLVNPLKEYVEGNNKLLHVGNPLDEKNNSVFVKKLVENFNKVYSNKIFDQILHEEKELQKNISSRLTEEGKKRFGLG